uniref:Uncharacterized protein n=1 Tax=Anguilla anguilla TaxID=7936 RepID=A0A0E9X6J6_ANGAN
MPVRLRLSGSISSNWCACSSLDNHIFKVGLHQGSRVLDVMSVKLFISQVSMLIIHVNT